MKFFHTADWHLGKVVHGFSMLADQRYILEQFILDIKKEQPDAVIIAGDLYDRAVPPTEAVQLLDEVLEEIVLKLKTPVLAIAGNHDSPSRLHFGSRLMKANGCHIVGQLVKDAQPVILQDQEGEVHFHLVPFADPSLMRHLFEDDEIRTHQDAMKTIIEHITYQMVPNCRHVFIGHAFVTPQGEAKPNSSDSERPLSIGGAEHVDAHLFTPFHYTALGHLHQAHHVLHETIRYAGSPLKYSISEEHHHKAYNLVQMDGQGNVTVERKTLQPLRDMRTIQGRLAELLKAPTDEDYIFVRLLDESPVMYPMEKIRAIYPNALHIERVHLPLTQSAEKQQQTDRHKLEPFALFQMFYKEVKGSVASSETEALFTEVVDELLKKEREERIG